MTLKAVINQAIRDKRTYKNRQIREYNQQVKAHNLAIQRFQREQNRAINSVKFDGRCAKPQTLVERLVKSCHIGLDVIRDRPGEVSYDVYVNVRNSLVDGIKYQGALGKTLTQELLDTLIQNFSELSDSCLSTLMDEYSIASIELEEYDSKSWFGRNFITTDKRELIEQYRAIKSTHEEYMMHIEENTQGIKDSFVKKEIID